MSRKKKYKAPSLKTDFSRKLDQMEAKMGNNSPTEKTSKAEKKKSTPLRNIFVSVTMLGGAMWGGNALLSDKDTTAPVNTSASSSIVQTEWGPIDTSTTNNPAQIITDGRAVNNTNTNTRFNTAATPVNDVVTPRMGTTLPPTSYRYDPHWGYNPHFYSDYDFYNNRYGYGPFGTHGPHHHLPH